MTELTLKQLQAKRRFCLDVREVDPGFEDLVEDETNVSFYGFTYRCEGCGDLYIAFQTNGKFFIPLPMHNVSCVSTLDEAEEILVRFYNEELI